ncbi:MAG: DsbA family oxidoreductase [Candidatus Dormibacteria bacterium]
MEKINFHFDPVCPWAWLTSRWAARLEELGEVELDWRFFSLGIVHLEEGNDAESGPVGYSGPALQMLSLARRQGGKELVASLYSELGRLLHHEGKRLTEDQSAAVVEAAMTAAGMDPAERAQHADDRDLWQSVVSDHRSAVASCEAFGVPTLILDGGHGPGLFGPVITEVPDGEESVELLRDVVRMARRPYLFELKRDREGHPPLV